MKIEKTEIGVEKRQLEGREVYRIFINDTESPIALLSFFKGKKKTLYIDLHKSWAEKSPQTPGRALKAFKRWWLTTNGVADSARKEVQRQLGQLHQQADLKIAKAEDWCSFSNYAEADK